jgi:hypothetical protein
LCCQRDAEPKGADKKKTAELARTTNHSKAERNPSSSGCATKE